MRFLMEVMSLKRGRLELTDDERRAIAVLLAGEGGADQPAGSPEGSPSPEPIVYPLSPPPVLSATFIAASSWGSARRGPY
jgi:hypothetical protein